MVNKVLRPVGRLSFLTRRAGHFGPPALLLAALLACKTDDNKAKEQKIPEPSHCWAPYDKPQINRRSVDALLWSLSPRDLQLSAFRRRLAEDHFWDQLKADHDKSVCISGQEAPSPALVAQKLELTPATAISAAKKAKSTVEVALDGSKKKEVFIPFNKKVKLNISVSLGGRFRLPREMGYSYVYYLVLPAGTGPQAGLTRLRLGSKEFYSQLSTLTEELSVQVKPRSNKRIEKAYISVFYEGPRDEQKEEIGRSAAVISLGQVYAPVESSYPWDSREPY